MRCPTVQIQMEPSEGNPTGAVTINESDYDSETMTLFSVGVEVAPAKPVKPVHSKTAQPSGAVSSPWSN